jgi:CBS domain-containing protein
MVTVREILDKKGHDVVSIDCEAKVLDAARLMSERHLGALVVVHGEKVIGIFTERDILNRIVGQARDPAATAIREVMTAPVACCSSKSPRAECRAVMRRNRIRHLPVVDDDRLVGIISIGDILEDESAEQSETIRYLYEYMNVDWE